MPRARRPTSLVIGAALLALSAAGCGSDSGSEASTGAGGASPQRSPTTADERLLGRLRAGGTVIVFRHAATSASDEDDERVDLTDCSTQRNLTAKGRADARTIGVAFEELSIPVGRVWASPYCRARHTAELAFGRGQVVDGLERLYPQVDEVADRRLNELIAEHAPDLEGPNLVIASHQIYPSALRPAVALQEGEAAVYSVRGEEVELLGQLTPDEWGRLDSTGPSANARELTQTAEQAQGSVVSVELAGEPAGAAFRVAIDAVAVTSARVVGDATAVTVVLSSGTRRPATVLGRARNVDIAVLELDDSGLPPMHSATGLADAEVGDPVLVVGPSIGPRKSFSTGVIGALDQLVGVGDSELEVLATDARSRPASSGGPLINANGDVLGVSTDIAPPAAEGVSAQGVLAIPVDVARSAALEIVRRAR
ncbi:MAG: trypsin-like peptidase domain-containing protein [Solirubrobacteraceae bacterium]